MVTRDTPYLITDIILDLVVNKKFSLLSLVLTKRIFLVLL